ncbi:MAG: cytochrome o ubiquinol oxidase subunit IV [Pseudomonadota bacterium]
MNDRVLQAVSDHRADDDLGVAHGNVKQYVLGLVLSLVLTAIPFTLVMFSEFPKGPIILTIFVCAIAQILVQLVFFLHMNGGSEQWWNTMSAVFVVILVAILIVGSIWVMQSMNHNMLMGH